MARARAGAGVRLLVLGCGIAMRQCGAFARACMRWIKADPKAAAALIAPAAAALVCALLAGVALPLMHDLRPAGIQPALRERRGGTSLVSRKAFLQQDLLLARDDSIGMSIDCIDSVAVLQIKGVNLRCAHIVNFRLNPPFRYLQKRRRTTAFPGDIFRLEKQWSTIPKNPIKVRKAPADSIQAESMQSEPRQEEHTDVFCMLVFDRRLIIEMRQKEPMALRAAVKIGWYHFRFGLHSFADVVSSLVRRRLPESWHVLRIDVSREDARAIYRALPSKAGLAFRLE
jgi:hypothetical protein